MFPYLSKDKPEYSDTRVMFFYEPALGWRAEDMGRMTADVQRARQQNKKIVYIMRCGNCVNNRAYNEQVMLYADVAFCHNCDRQYRGMGRRPADSLRYLFTLVAEERKQEAAQEAIKAAKAASGSGDKKRAVNAASARGKIVSANSATYFQVAPTVVRGW